MDRERSKNGPSHDLGSSSPAILSMPLLPSRQRAYAILKDATDRARGPIVIGGPAGVGKTWIWKRLEAESPVGREWVSVCASPEMTAVDLLVLTAYQFGATLPRRAEHQLGLLRAALLDRLSSLADAGLEVVLAVENAHHLEPSGREELLALAEDAEPTGALRAVILSGRAAGERRRAASRIDGLEPRLSARIQLTPIDVDEARAWLQWHHPEHGWTDREVELLHREARGIPALLDRLAVARPSSVGLSTPRESSNPLAQRAVIETAMPVAEPPRLAPTPISPAPLVGHSRPPIEIQENAVEVGWTPEDEAEDAEAFDEPAATTPPSARPEVPPLVIQTSSPITPWPADAMEEGEPGEAVDVKDRYAALQAWEEWSRNQSSSRNPGPSSRTPTPPDPAPTFARRDGTQEVWAETEQEFAPYGPIFQKSKPARES